MTEQNICKAISCPYTSNFECHFYPSANACHLLPGEPQDGLRSCGYFLYSTKANVSKLRRDNDLYLSRDERYLKDIKALEVDSSSKFPNRSVRPERYAVFVGDISEGAEGKQALGYENSLEEASSIADRAQLGYWKEVNIVDLSTSTIVLRKEAESRQWSISTPDEFKWKVK